MSAKVLPIGQSGAGSRDRPASPYLRSAFPGFAPPVMLRFPQDEANDRSGTDVAGLAGAFAG
jgi:hypothetical protein